MPKTTPPTDTELLNFIEQRGKPGMLWVSRESSNGRGYQLHNIPQVLASGADQVRQTARKAIAAEMEQFPMVWHSKQNHPEFKGKRCRVIKFKDNYAVIVFPDGSKIEGCRTWLRRA